MQAENKGKPKLIKKSQTVAHDKLLTKVFENKVSYLKVMLIIYAVIVKIPSQICSKKIRKKTANQQVLC